MCLAGLLGVKTVTPRSMAVRWPKPRDLRSVGSMVVRAGITIGLVLGLVLPALALYSGSSPSDSLTIGIIVGLYGGIAGGLIFGVPLGLIDVWLIPLAATSDVTPRLVYHRDVRSHLVSGLMGAPIGGIVGGLFGYLIGSPVLLFALIFGLTFGLTLGLVSGFRAGAATSLLFAELALWPRRRRAQFMPLLETALDGQVLRQAGAVYQFRHADLQDRLADRYQAAAGPLRKEQRRRDTPPLLRSLWQRAAPLRPRWWVVVLALSGALLLLSYGSRPSMDQLPADLRASCSVQGADSGWPRPLGEAAGRLRHLVRNAADRAAAQRVEQRLQNNKDFSEAACRLPDGTIVLYRLFNTATEARADVVNGNELAPNGTPCPPAAPPAETVVCSYVAGAETGVAAFSQTVKPPERFYGVRWNPDAHPQLSGAMTTANTTAQDWENLRSNWTRLAGMH
jgi:hypothetical protein